jgi:hypothetical protein
MYVFVSHGLTGESGRAGEVVPKTLPAILQVAGFQQIGKSNAELEC